MINELPDYLSNWMNKKHTTIIEDFLDLILSPFTCFSRLYNDVGVEPVIGNDDEMGQHYLWYLINQYIEGRKQEFGRYL
jgi:hypothetical protein